MYQWVAHMLCHHLIRGKPFENLGLVWLLARVTYEHAIGWKQEKCNNINFTWLSFFDNLQIITKARLPFERYSAYLAVVYLVIAYVCTQSCPTLWDLMDYSPPGFSVHGILQASILERAAISYSNESSWPRDPPLGSYVSLLPLALAGGFFTTVPPDH